MARRLSHTVNLALSDADAASSRRGLREFFTTQVPADIPGPRTPGESELSRTTSSRRMRSSTRRGWRCRIGPVEWGGQGLVTAAAPDLGRTSCRWPASRTAGVQRQHGGPGDRAVRFPRRSRNGSYRPPPTSTSGGARAFRSRKPDRTWHRFAPPRCATATATSSTARRPGPRLASTRTGSSSCPHRSERTEDRPVSHSSSLKWPLPESL